MHHTAGAAALVIALTAAGAAQAQGRPPAPVLTAVQAMDTMCREFGTPGDKSGLLRAADLNGDGVADWVLDEGAYVCEGAASLFGGSGGSQVTVWAGRGNGGVSQPFSHGAFGAAIEDGRLWLMVGGEMCGQKTAGLARAEYEGCRRPLAWDARAEQFDFAPVSEARPLE